MRMSDWSSDVCSSDLPNGIQITATGTVRAAGFVASTLDIGDDDFMRGDIVVSGHGGRVANAGTIAIVRGGYAALIGGQVDHSGFIPAPLGRVALGAGTRAAPDLAGFGIAAWRARRCQDV